MNSDKPKPLPTMQSIKDDFEQAMMTGEIKPVAKCLFKQSQDGLHEHINALTAQIAKLEEERDLWKSQLLFIKEVVVTKIEVLTALEESSELVFENDGTWELKTNATPEGKITKVKIGDREKDCSVSVKAGDAILVNTKTLEVKTEDQS